jgi:hypothetical protein
VNGDHAFVMPFVPVMQQPLPVQFGHEAPRQPFGIHAFDVGGQHDEFHEAGGKQAPFAANPLQPAFHGDGQFVLQLGLFQPAVFQPAPLQFEGPNCGPQGPHGAQGGPPTGVQFTGANGEPKHAPCGGHMVPIELPPHIPPNPLKQLFIGLRSAEGNRNFGARREKNLQIVGPPRWHAGAPHRGGTGAAELVGERAFVLVRKELQVGAAADLDDGAIGAEAEDVRSIRRRRHDRLRRRESEMLHGERDHEGHRDRRT